MSDAKIPKSPRILVAPLGWGLGHATRCIPLIRELKKYPVELFLASDGRAKLLLEQEFPDLLVFSLPSYAVSYPLKSMTLNVVLQSPRIIWNILREKQMLRKYVKQYQIGVVISDNRFGCFSNVTKNIFLSHQLNLKIPNPFLQKWANRLNRFFIRQFNECWVPDLEENSNLSGDLSHATPLPNIRFIGPLSRMKKSSSPRKYDILALLSGPEPQRSRLERKLIHQLKNIPNIQCLIVQGKTEEKEAFYVAENMKCRSYLLSKELEQIFSESEVVICRSGYSTIMDLVKLEKKAVLIPTPGQTEQEYLACFHQWVPHWVIQDQDQINIAAAWEELQTKEVEPVIPKSSFTVFKTAIKNLIEEATFY